MTPSTARRARTIGSVSGVLTAFALLAGCSSTDRTIDPLAPTRFKGTTSDGVTWVGYGDARITIEYVRSPQITFTFEGAAGGGHWSGSFGISEANAFDSTITAEINPTKPLGVGVGSIERSDASGGVALSGNIVIVRDGSNVKGTISVTPARVGGTFQASCRVECWVPPSMLGSPPDGTSSGTSQVLDRGWTSDFCKKYLPVVR